MSTNAIEVNGLTFAYPGARGGRAVLRELTLAVPTGARCLLIGANGAGKSTLLRVLDGRYLLPHDQVRVLGRPAFHDTALAAERVFLGGAFPLDVDLSVDEILRGQRGVEAARVERICAILDIDRGWHMHTVSDGQRRRVQILLGLLRPSRVLLLDEITTDLDVIARVDLLGFLRQESARGATMLYASHILDGLERWATHVAHLAHGQIRWMGPLDALPELQAARSRGEGLLHVVEAWLRAERVAF